MLGLRVAKFEPTLLMPFLSSAEYERLSSSSEDLLDTAKKDRPKNKTGTDGRLLIFALVVALASLGISLTSIVASPRVSQAATVSGVLPRPNAYIGLEHVTFPSGTTVPPIFNRPLSAFKIDTTDASRAMSEDDRQYATEEGAVVPEDLHVVISAQFSTIMQFRAMDWGMENCVLQLDVPPPGDHNGTIVHDPTVVDIWRLDGRAELLPHISWNKAPPRVERLASLRFAAGENAGNIDLHCSSGSFLTFELACSSETPECLLEFWQDKQRGDQNGIHIVQHWSRG